MNLRDPGPDDKAKRPPMPASGVGAAVVARNRGTNPGERRAAVFRECPSKRNRFYPMGECTHGYR
jgi:hypothetical protein